MSGVPLPEFAKRAAEHVIGARGKKLLKYVALRSQVLLGKQPFTSDHGFDRHIVPYLPHDGFFVEAGGNDGFSNSDTYYLEKKLNWKGILVEPVPQLAAFAQKIRHAKVYNAALGSPEHTGEIVSLNFCDSASRVDGTRAPVKWSGILGPNPKRVSAKIRTLSDILDEEGVLQVDFLSLDVEGYELEALKGIDFSRHKPTFMLIESYAPDAIFSFLSRNYKLIFKASPYDFFFESLP